MLTEGLYKDCKKNVTVTQIWVTNLDKVVFFPVQMWNTEIIVITIICLPLLQHTCNYRRQEFQYTTKEQKFKDTLYNKSIRCTQLIILFLFIYFLICINPFRTTVYGKETWKHLIFCLILHECDKTFRNAWAIEMIVIFTALLLEKKKNLNKLEK